MMAKHPLHTIFNNALNPFHENASTTEHLILQKFVALVKAGANPERLGPEGSVLDHAKSYKKKLRWSFVRTEGDDERRSREIDRITGYLEISMADVIYGSA